jgi:hypothetical protein
LNFVFYIAASKYEVFFKVGKPATETFKMLQNAGGDAAVCHACIFNSLKVQDFAGEPKCEFVAQNLETFLKVYKLEFADSVITLQSMQYQLHSNEECVRFFVKI